MREEVDSIDPDRLLNTSVDDLVQYFAGKYGVDVPVLDVDNLVVDQREEQVDVSRDPMRMIRDRSRPFYIAGAQVDVEIPFDGDRSAFRIQPNSFTLNPPRAQVRDGHVHFALSGTDLTAPQVRAEIDRTVASIQSYLVNLRANAASLNDQLPGEARQVRLIRSRGHFLKGRYDVHNGRYPHAASAPTVHG